MKRVLNTLPFSVTLKYTQIANDLISKGKDVVKLTAGEPDFPTPDLICEAAKFAIDEGFTKYTASSGITELRLGISRMLKEKYGLVYESDEIVVSNGGKQALYNAIYSISDEGDEIILFSPDWVSYIPQIRFCGCREVLIETFMENSFIPDMDTVKKSITEKTRAIIINSPNNPTGAVYPLDVLEELAEIAKAHDIFVISDEIYANLNYEGTHVSIASLPGMKERTIVLNGFSKSHSMTGWRVGYTAAPTAISKTIGKFQSHLTSNINSIAQRAALAALDVNTDYMLVEFDKRRKVVCEGLEETGIPFYRPKGAFYVFMDFRWCKDLFKNDDELTMHLIEKYGIVLIPGSAFNSPFFMRLSYASSVETIEKALERISSFKSSL